MATATAKQPDEHGPVLEATPARQGLRGRHVLWILIISTALAAIALAILLGVSNRGLSGPGGQTGSDSARPFHAPVRTPQS